MWSYFIHKESKSTLLLPVCDSWILSHRCWFFSFSFVGLPGFCPVSAGCNRDRVMDIILLAAYYSPAAPCQSIYTHLPSLLLCQPCTSCRPSLLCLPVCFSSDTWRKLTWKVNKYFHWNISEVNCDSFFFYHRLPPEGSLIKLNPRFSVSSLLSLPIWALMHISGCSPLALPHNKASPLQDQVPVHDCWPEFDFVMTYFSRAPPTLPTHPHPAHTPCLLPPRNKLKWPPSILQPWQITALPN